MNFLVTGGTGFIGKALVKRLLKDGHHVAILTRNKKKADCFVFNSRVFIQQYNNYNRYDDLADILKGIPHQIDGVFHLAANMKYLGKKHLLFNDNVVYTRRLLEWSLKNKVKFFIYTSSIDAMGPNSSDKIPLNENHFCRPLSTYGWSKYEAEKTVSRFGRKTDLRTLSLRLGNIYGPGSKFIIIDIAQALVEGRSNPLVKYYHQIKNCKVHLCYIDDVVEGIYQTVSTQYKSGDVFILSGNEPTTIENLFYYISSALNKEFNPTKNKLWYDLMIKFRKFYYLTIKNKADRVTYFKLGNWFVSIKKAKEALNFKPKVSLREGIFRTLQWGMNQ